MHVYPEQKQPGYKKCKVKVIRTKTSDIKLKDGQEDKIFVFFYCDRNDILQGIFITMIDCHLATFTDNTKRIKSIVVVKIPCKIATVKEYESFVFLTFLDIRCFGRF